MRMKCEGQCEQHIGRVVRVEVFDNVTMKSWGDFDYCQQAIEDDRAKGFTVKIYTGPNAGEVK